MPAPCASDAAPVATDWAPACAWWLPFPGGQAADELPGAGVEWRGAGLELTELWTGGRQAAGERPRPSATSPEPASAACSSPTSGASGWAAT